MRVSVNSGLFDYLFVQPFCIFLRIGSIVFLKFFLEVDVAEKSSYEFPDMNRSEGGLRPDDHYTLHVYLFIYFQFIYR